MMNLSCCRFGNTEIALSECLEALLNREIESKEEVSNAIRLFSKILDFSYEEGIINKYDEQRLKEFIAECFAEESEEDVDDWSICQSSNGDEMQTTIDDVKNLFDDFSPDEFMLAFNIIYTDTQLETMWAELGDAAIDNKDCIQVPFYWWKVGTNRFDIWHWFNVMHSKGIAAGLLKMEK